MSKQDSQIGIKRPTIFFIILDFLVSLIICIILMEVEYSSDPGAKALQKKGRIIMSVILFLRVLYSCFAEWARQNLFKPYLIDT